MSGTTVPDKAASRWPSYDSQEMFSHVLAEGLGGEVLAEADNGRSAIEEAERHHPELMLLDVSMPVMGGLPAARYLHEHLPDLSIIFVSQYSWKVYAEEALESGARGYVVGVGGG